MPKEIFSRHLVDPEILGLAESFSPQMLSDETIETARASPLVSTEMHVVSSGFHGFELFAPDAVISKGFLAEISPVLNAVFYRSSCQ